jgi:ribosomal protein S18 acetylase RimI-like enzyme
VSAQALQGIELRPAGPDDAEAIHALILALAKDVGCEDRVSSAPADFRRHGRGPAPGFEALLAERDGVPLGLCLYFFSFSSWRGERGVYVQDIWVDPAVRGSGLARRLIEATARRAAAQGARYLRLSVDRENQAARSFYDRLGLEYGARECIYMASGAAFEALAGADTAPAG